MNGLCRRALGLKGLTTLAVLIQMRRFDSPHLAEANDENGCRSRDSRSLQGGMRFLVEGTGACGAYAGAALRDAVRV